MKRAIGWAISVVFVVLAAGLFAIIMPLALSDQTPAVDRAGYLGMAALLAFAAPRFAFDRAGRNRPGTPPPAPEGDPPAKPKR